MKALNLMLLFFLLAGSAVAQSASGRQDPPDLVVIESSWRRLEHYPRLEDEPILANQRTVRMQRPQQDVKEGVAQVNPQVRPIPTRGSNQISVPTQSMPGKPWVEYLYGIKVSNTGTKTIRKLVWEYVSSTSDAQPTVGRRRFISQSKIGPGKTKKLVESSIFPPLGVIDARQAGQKTQVQSPEQVVIRKIEYTDGSVWTRDSE